MAADPEARPRSRASRRLKLVTGVAWPLLALGLAAWILVLSARPRQEPPARVFRPLELPVPAPVLSEEERAYLERLGPVPFCVDPDWEPYEKIEDGRYVGIAADLVRLIAARAGVELALRPTKDWKESIAAVRAGEGLLLAFLNETPERAEWLSFTSPYFADPNVFITRDGHEFIVDPAVLEGQTLVLPEGTSLEEYLRGRYPEIPLLTVKSELEALDAVEEGRADATLRSLTMAAYVIRKEGRFNLRISGKLPEFQNEFRIGVAKSEPRLREILDRGVRSLTAREVQAVVNAHVAIEARTAVDYRALVVAVALFSLVSAAWIAWNLSLRRHMRHLRLIIDTVPAFIFAKDRRGRYLLANRWTATAFGVPPEEVVGLTDRDCRATEEEIAAFLAQDRQVLERGEPFVLDEHPGRRVDGSPGWFKTIKVPYRQPGSKAEAILGVTIDITEQKRASLELEERERRFRHLAQHDGLTGLPNRALFSDRLGQALALCRREGSRLALAFLDLDKFKEVNDRLGHAAGDELLRQAAERMRSSLRESDAVGRIGGDEFILFFRGVEDRAAALLVAEKLRAVLEAPFELAGARAEVSASLGLALYPDDGAEEAELLRRADAAMYRSKSAGKNRVTAYEPGSDAEGGGGAD